MSLAKQPRILGLHNRNALHNQTMQSRTSNLFRESIHTKQGASKDTQRCEAASVHNTISVTGAAKHAGENAAALGATNCAKKVVSLRLPGGWREEHLEETHGPVEVNPLFEAVTLICQARPSVEQSSMQVIAPASMGQMLLIPPKEIGRCRCLAAVSDSGNDS